MIREKEDLIRQLRDSEQLTKDLSDTSQGNILKLNEELSESKKTEVWIIHKLNILRSEISELEARNENEIASATSEIEKLKSEKEDGERNFEIMKKASIDNVIEYDHKIQRLYEQINDLEQEKAVNDERFTVFREQSEQEKAANLERMRVLNEQLERPDIGENVRSNIEREREILEERNNELSAQVEIELEEIEDRNSKIDVELDGDPERMTLREKIKNIF